MNFVLVPAHLEFICGLLYVGLVGKCVSDVTRSFIEDQFVSFTIVIDVLTFERGRQICLEVI